MKKIILFCLLACSITSFAQTTYPGYPLFGTASNTDRTYRSLQLGISTIADTLGSTIDTIQLIPGFVAGAGSVFEKWYVLNLKDSCVLAISNVSNSYNYSRIHIVINAPAISSKVKFLGYSGLTTQWYLTSAATSVSPTASHTLVMDFICLYGSGWYQTGQSQD